MKKKLEERLEVVLLIDSGVLLQKKGALRLNISTRQMKRIMRRYRTEGISGLSNKHCGRRAKNVIDSNLRKKIEDLAGSRYKGFAPTFLTEKLQEEHGIVISIESTRKILMSAGHWKAKRGKEVKRHPLRERREMFGELIQIDGSPHDWFEGRAPTCTLLVFIDDATGRLTQLRFAPSETTFGYMHCLYEHILTYGMPMALYSDRHSIFRYNGEAEAQTQFGRALEELGIELINANTPQAKGRVERVNLTLQDRLIKEMRLADINGIEEANQWLPEYVEKFNKRFGVEASKQEEAHVAWMESESKLRRILSVRSERTLSKELTLSYNGRCLQIKSTGRGLGLRKSRVEVREGFDGKLEVQWQGREILYEEIKVAKRRKSIISSKEINGYMDGLLRMHKGEKVVDSGIARSLRDAPPLRARPSATAHLGVR